MTRTPDDFDSDDLDARWDDLTARLGPLAAPQGSPGPRDYEVVEDEGRFEEPDPPLGNPNPATVLGWLALGSGILALFLGVVAPTPGWVPALGLALAIGGLVSLVMRLPRHEERDDDGAQV